MLLAAPRAHSVNSLSLPIDSSHSSSGLSVYLTLKCNLLFFQNADNLSGCPLLSKSAVEAVSSTSSGLDGGEHFL